jgi:hypothetical protein
MAQFYTLEEAARVLGMNPEELKAKAQQREIRAFLDGGSWRFRVVDVDELARRRGLGSDADLRLSDLELPVATPDDESNVDLSEFQLGVAKPDLGAPTMDLPKSEPGSSSDQDILLDDLSLPPNPMNASSSVIIGMHSTTSKMPSDSDVRLVPDTPKGVRPSDSDVRLATPQDFKKASDSDVTLIADDTGEHRRPGSSSSSDTAVRPSPFSGSSMEVPAPSPPDSDSDFELSPSSGIIDALQPESGSDFELTALEEASSDEFDSTPMLKPGDSDVTAADPGFSGINLSRPSDSGINLQMASGLGLGGASSIELAPLSGDDIKVPPPPKSKPGPKSSPAETPVPAAKAEKDIFDDTDFEVDALESDHDSDDKTVQLEAASDFELEEEDTGSEVFAIDEEDVDTSAATALGPAVLEEEEEDDGFAEATSGEMASAWDVESETPSAATAGRSAASVGSVLAPAAATAEWGGVWVGMLGVATLFMLFLAFVSMDLVRNLYDFQGESPASGLVRGLASLVSG